MVSSRQSLREDRFATETSEGVQPAVCAAGGLGERQMKIYPWGKLPACRFLNFRRLEAYATVRNELPLAFG
jgi:hypothetical protein